MRVVALAALVVSLLHSGLPQAAAAAAGSGVVGIVRLPQACLPSVRSCPPHLPYVLIRVLRPASGQLVATARPGRQGRFRIPLESGRYALEGVSPAGASLIARRLVRVRPHAFTLVVLTRGDPLR